MSSVARDPSDVAWQDLTATPLALDAVLVRPTVGPLVIRSAGSSNNAELEQALPRIRRRAGNSFAGAGREDLRNYCSKLF